MDEQPPAGSETASSSLEAGSREKLFLGGLSWETNEDKVRQHFEKYGELSEVVVMRDRITGKPRGFGFVTFKDRDAADRVCREPQILDGRQVDAKRSVPQEQKPRSKKIFVGGLAPDTTEDQFQEYFERYGVVTEAQIMQDHTSGRSRGFGFITFEDESSVEACFLAGSMHELGGKRVEVKTATPRGSGPMPRTTLPSIPTGIGLRSPGARPLFAGTRPAFPGFPPQVGPAGAYPVQYPAGMSGFQSATVMGAYGMGPPFAYNPYANMMLGGYPFPQYAYGPQYAGQAAAIAAAAQQQQQMGGYRAAAGPPAHGPSAFRPDAARLQGMAGPPGVPGHIAPQQLQQRLQSSSMPRAEVSGGAGPRAGPSASREPPPVMGSPLAAARAIPGPAPPSEPHPSTLTPRTSQAREPQQQQQHHRQHSPQQPRQIQSSNLQLYNAQPQPPLQQSQQQQQQPQQQQVSQQQFRQGQERMSSYMLPSHSASGSRPQPRAPPS